MKKWTVVAIMALMALIGCRKRHIYHTYYGDIDIDTMEVFTDEDGTLYYAVHTTMLDSLQAAAMGLDSVWLVDYYIPSQNKYFMMANGSDGGGSPKVYYNPENEKVDSIR